MPAGATLATTGQLAGLLNAQLVGPDDLALERLGSIEDTEPALLTFIRDADYARHWAGSSAAAALVSTGIDVPGHDPATRALIYVENADLALAAVLEHYSPKPDLPPAGVHPDASVHPDAKLDPAARVGPGCTIAAGARVGAHAALIAGVHLSAGASVGDHTTLHPGVCLGERCSIGSHTIIHSNVVIGADGFGYVPDPASGVPRKVPHLGAVTVGDHVEIGAGTCIDRAKFGSTEIHDHAKIDNLVQIGHNCVIGRAAIICGQVAIAGSVTVGEHSLIGGACMIADNLKIGARVKLGGGSALIHDIPDGENWIGHPAALARNYMLTHNELQKLAEESRQARRAKKRARPT